MTRMTIGVLAVLLTLGSAGCSARPDERSGQKAAPTTSSTTVTTTSAAVAATTQTCELLDTAALNQSFNAGMAIGGEKGPAMRDGVAATYREFADLVVQISLAAPENLRPVLTEWASASREVAQFVVGNEPPPGIVLELGPAHPRWQAARTAAEEICGHPLPDTDQ